MAWHEFLSHKQEAFVLAYLARGNAKEAARDAGYKTSSAHTVLLKNPKVVARLREIRDMVAIPAVMSDVRRREVLSEIAASAHRQPIKAGDRIAAIAELNKLEGAYAPEKHAVAVVERRVSFVFIMPDGTNIMPKELVDGSSYRPPG